MSGNVQRLSRLIRGAGVQALEPVGSDPEIHGTCLDSRLVKKGDLFFAFKGQRSDGERFVPQAIERGAAAIVATSPRPSWIESGVAWVRVESPRRAAGLLSREYHGRPDEALALVGITGTNGKTTVAHMVEKIALAAGRSAGRIGTVGSAYGGVERPLERTTPEAPEVYRLLSEMRAGAVDIVAMEVSSHALTLSRVEGARFATAAFLNLGRDHLDFHGSEKAYFEAKARLFERLGPTQHAVLPADSHHGSRLRDRTHARVWTFGRSGSSDIRLQDERGDLDGSTATLDTPAGRLCIRCRLAGGFNLENAAAAAACALATGLPARSIPVGLASLGRVPGRMERVDCGQPFAVLVDYAHTAEALEGLLGWVRSAVDGRVLVVFGCGGERDVGKRQVMGRVAATYADRLFLTSDNPRGEDPQEILDEIARGVASVGTEAHCSALVDRREAIAAAIGAAESRDVVVVAGKGHETTQTVGSANRPFDDRIVAAHVLKQLGWTGVRRAGA